ncbi:MAG: isopentenyl phosphate kinase [Fervidicoccaceae archaeon]
MKVVLKLGGSLITDKAKAYTAREEIIQSLARRMKEAQDKGALILVVHGGGSFGHVAAKSEIDKHGKLHPTSVPGISSAMMNLNSIVMTHLLRAGLRAVTYPPHSMCLYSCRESRFNCSLEPLYEAADAGLLPVTFGDVVLGERGCEPKIISGDDLALMMGSRIGADRIIFATDVDGVMRNPSNPLTLIETIRAEDIPKIISEISFTSNGTVDVTSGLLGKIMKIYSYLSSLSQRPEVLIINGRIEERVLGALLGADVRGTRII